MKLLFSRYLPALLIAALLLTPTAWMEVASEDMPIQDTPLRESTAETQDTPAEAQAPDKEATVPVDAVDDVPEETEVALDDETPVAEMPEIDLEGETVEWSSEAAYGVEEDDPEPVCWVDAPLEDSDALFEGYVRGLFGLNPPILFEARNVGGDLTGAKKALYDTVSACILEIAAGRRASTEITFSNDSGLTPEDVLDVVRCVTADHPYEMYWHTNSTSAQFYGDSVTIGFDVDSAYSAGKYTFDTSTAVIAAQAAANARAIVGKYANRSDYDKLVAYRDEICDAVKYNHDAASTTWDMTRTDPWQLIWVFDGDPSTNVVCEGYAKAFQYLCDMTSFSGNVVCYCATGYVNSGAHMWNIVRMPNGKNYLVDITQCDNDNGNYDWLFMRAPVSGSVSGGYRFHVVNGNAYTDSTYVYDEGLLRIFSAGDLTLAGSDYLSKANETTETVSETAETVPDATELSLGSEPGDAPVASDTAPASSVPTIVAARARIKHTVYAAPGTAIQLDLAGATGKKFKSSKKKVATVSSAGLITVKKAGKTKITFKVGKKTRSVTLTIKDPTVPNAIALNAYGTIAAKKGDTVALTATLPEGTYSGIRWKSSNKKVATVSNGVVTFKKKGKVTITATATRGKKKARVKFKVSN